MNRIERQDRGVPRSRILHSGLKRLASFLISSSILAEHSFPVWSTVDTQPPIVYGGMWSAPCASPWCRDVEHTCDWTPGRGDLTAATSLRGNYNPSIPCPIWMGLLFSLRGCSAAREICDSQSIMFVFGGFAIAVPSNFRFFIGWIKTCVRSFK